MEVLIHFIFELIKISILGCIYATLTLFITLFIGHFRQGSWFDKVTENKWRFWVNSGLIISIGLLLFMFTYFGDHGLGDSARVPIGHFKVVNFGSYAYLQNDKGDQLSILKFTFDKDKLYAETIIGVGEKRGEYVVWDLCADEWIFYKNKDEYLYNAQKMGYPNVDSFENFWEFYNRHWQGWRFWVLP